MNMVVHAYDIFFYLSSWSTISYLWSDQRRYLVALVGALLGTTAVAWLAYRADSTRVARRWAALALPLLRSPRLVRCRRQRRAPTHAILLREPVRLVLLCILGRDAGDAVARGAAGGGTARCRGQRRFQHSGVMRRHGQAAAHHPDPPGVGGAAVAVPDAALRPLGGPLLPLLRRSPPPAAGGNVWRRLVADGVLAARRRLDPCLRRHAPVRADFHAEQAERHAAASARALRLPQRRVLPDDAQLRLQRPLLHLDRAQRDLRHALARRQDRPGARPLLLRQRHGRDGAALQVVAQAALHVHPDHVGALALRLQVRAGRRGAGRRPGHRTRRWTNTCAASPWPRSISTS